MVALLKLRSVEALYMFRQILQLDFLCLMLMNHGTLNCSWLAENMVDEGEMESGMF